MDFAGVLFLFFFVSFIWLCLSPVSAANDETKSVTNAGKRWRKSKLTKDSHPHLHITCNKLSATESNGIFLLLLHALNQRWKKLMSGGKKVVRIKSCLANGNQSKVLHKHRERTRNKKSLLHTKRNFYGSVQSFLIPGITVKWLHIQAQSAPTEGDEGKKNLRWNR